MTIPRRDRMLQWWKDRMISASRSRSSWAWESAPAFNTLTATSSIMLLLTFPVIPSGNLNWPEKSMDLSYLSISSLLQPDFSTKFSTRKLTSNLVYNQREYWFIYLSIDDVPLKTLPKHPSPISRSSSIHSGLMMMNDLKRPFPSQSSVAVDKLEAQYSGLLVSLSWRMTFLDKHTGICVIVITIILSGSCYFITNIQVFSHISFLAWSFFFLFSSWMR